MTITSENMRYRSYTGFSMVMGSFWENKLYISDCKQVFLYDLYKSEDGNWFIGGVNKDFTILINNLIIHYNLDKCFKVIENHKLSMVDSLHYYLVEINGGSHFQVWLFSMLVSPFCRIRNDQEKFITSHERFFEVFDNLKYWNLEDVSSTPDLEYRSALKAYLTDGGHSDNPFMVMLDTDQGYLEPSSISSKVKHSKTGKTYYF